MKRLNILEGALAVLFAISSLSLVMILNASHYENYQSLYFEKVFDGKREITDRTPSQSGYYTIAKSINDIAQAIQIHSEKHRDPKWIAPLILMVSSLILIVWIELFRFKHYLTGSSEKAVAGTHQGSS